MSKEQDITEWFDRRNLALDLAGLTDEERREGSIVMGGSGIEFVVPEDDFSFNAISYVIFKWGDKRAEDVFAVVLEHDDNPDPGFFVPFSATVVIGEQAWATAIQSKDFDPETAYPSDAYYCALPFDEADGAAALQEYLSLPVPRQAELLGKVGTRWLAFEMAVDLHE